MRHTVTFFINFALISFAILLPCQTLAQSGKNTVGVTYCYPAPNSIQVSAKTSIGIRYIEKLVRSNLKANSFLVVGAISGPHTGAITLALDGRTLIFAPNKNFSSGEKVKVNVSSLTCVSGKLTVPYVLNFQILKSKVSPHFLRKIAESSDSLSTVRSAPPLLDFETNAADTLPVGFPSIRITKSNNPAPGNIYMANFRDTHNDSGTYMIKMDNGGHILFERSTWPSYATDFKPQPNGMYTYFDKDLGQDNTDFKYKYYGMDSNFVVRDSFEAVNGYLTDDHELLFLPGGGFALIGEIDEQLDTRTLVPQGYKGDSSTTVASNIIQEFDSSKNLIFEWRTRDHFVISDMTNTDFDFTFLDFTHCNSIENDGDTAFIISSRDLDEVTKISRKDGHVIWRWGGKNNEFKFVNDSLIFSRQHAVRRLKNGNIVLFDNGVFHHTPFPFSRAVEYHLDEEAKIATDVWEYHHNPEVYGYIMGYVQELDNGNRLICWGGCDSVAVTEVKPDGTTALEIKFDPGTYTYRAFKYEDHAFTTNVLLQPSVSDLSTAQIFPNPFVKTTTINFHLSSPTQLKLSVYDALGREVAILFDGFAEAGSYSSTFDGSNMPSGTYYSKLSGPSSSFTQIMVLSK